MSEENNIKTDAPATAPEMPEVKPENTTLGVADLQNAAHVIDIAVQRGAFRAGEVAQVGAVFNRLTAFISQVQEQQKPAEEAKAPAPTAE